MTSFLDRALALASAGYRVFPLAPNSKIPALEADWKRIATSDHDRVRSLWTDPITGWEQPYNIGIALDRDTLVIDVDVRDGKHGARSLALLEAVNDSLPDTYTVRTASGGEHRYFKVDPNAGPFARTIATDIDLKGDGGFVVGAGSVIDGRVYESVKGPSLATLPEDYLNLAARGGRERTHAASSAHLVELDDPQQIERARLWLKESAPRAIQYAGGDGTTFAVAARVIDYGLSVEVARDLMLDHWNEDCSPPWDPADLEIKVRNATRHRQNAVGIASPEAEFGPVEVEDRRTKPPRPKLYYERWRDVTFATNSVSLIDGWYDRGAMVVTYGESGSGKTHVVLSQAIAIATGEKWCEHETHAGLVVYVAAEGGRGIRKRVAAWRARLGKDDIAFALVPCPVDLMRPAGDTRALIDLIKAAEKDFGPRAVMVVIDTASRALAGGNENAPDDMGAFVMHCDRIREATGATVHVIHHSGKNKAAGARGHSLLRAATDTEIEVSQNRITATKQRDMDTPRAITFRLQTVNLGTDDRGRRVTTAIPTLSQESEFEVHISPAAEKFLEVLREIEENSDNPDIAVKGTRWKDWWTTATTHECATNGLLQSVKTRQGLARLCNTLQQNGLVVNIMRDQWVTAELQQLQQTATR